MTKRQRKGGYLFQRPGSAHWWIKLQAPSNIKRSLGTPERLEAEILAMPLIAQHKARLLANAAPPAGITWQHEYEPGRQHPGPDGGTIVATERELLYLDQDGRIRIRGPNGGPLAFAVPGANVGGPVGHSRRPTLAVRSADDAILDTYLKHAGLNQRIEKEARDTWALYKTLTNNKPLKDADREDGRKLVAFFEGRGLKSATIRKKIGWLTAAVKLEMDNKEPRLKFNPFSGVVPRRDDKNDRLPLDSADMKAIRGGLAGLAKSDQVLLRLLASTGLRLGEAFQINSEATERGCRYVVIGSKTAQSRRRVPLPAAVLPFLPKPIRGPLFNGGAPAASKRLNRFLRDVGIDDRRKVVHSFRHRAKDRLRAAGCPMDVQYELLGHEDTTVAAGYGKGSPVPMLRKWIDKIGC